MAELSEYEIRLMRREEIPDVLDIWRKTGLSEGTHTIDTWFDYDPEGFYVAATHDGTILGMCAGILQNEDLAFVGLYAVREEFQRRGIGRKIWSKVMERVGDRNAAVNAVPEQLENYRDRGGFPVQTDWYSVVREAEEVLTSELVTSLPGIRVHLLREDSDIMDSVVEYEADIYGFKRENLVPKLSVEGETMTFVAVRNDDNSVCGFGTVKQNIIGNALVGPLYADDSGVAELIVHNMMEAFPVAKTRGMTLMSLDCNQEAVSMFDKLGFSCKPGVPRLYRKQEVQVKFHKIFCQYNLNFSLF